MTILLSSAVMLSAFVVILIIERRHAKRSKEFLRKSEEMIIDLACRAEDRYKQKYGKDPTGRISTLTGRKDSKI